VLRAVAQGLGTAPSALRLITGRAGGIKVIDIGNQTLPAA
jgi:hypothetical protein